MDLNSKHESRNRFFIQVYLSAPAFSKIIITSCFLNNVSCGNFWTFLKKWTLTSLTGARCEWSLHGKSFVSCSRSRTLGRTPKEFSRTYNSKEQKLVQLWNTVLFATQNVKSEIYRLSIPETVQVAKSPGSVINYISYLSW